LRQRQERTENYIQARINNTSYERYEKSHTHNELQPEVQEFKDKIQHDKILKQFKMDPARISAKRQKRNDRASSKIHLSVRESSRTNHE